MPSITVYVHPIQADIRPSHTHLVSPITVGLWYPHTYEGPFAFYYPSSIYMPTGPPGNTKDVHRKDEQIHWHYLLSVV